MEAVINGANAGVKLVVGIGAMLIAFLGLVALIDLLFQGGGGYVKQTLTLSADATDQSLEASLIGGTLFTVQIVTSADDAVTFTIKSNRGTTMLTTTTTSATSGEWASPSDRYPIDGLPTYTLSGLGSGTATIDVYVWRF